MKSKAYLYVIIAASLWGIISIFLNKMTALGFGTMETVFFRSIVTAVTMCIYIIVKDKKLLKINLCDLWIFIGSGVISFVFFSFCYFTAIRLTSVSVAAVLLYTSPIFVAVMSRILFGEKLTKTKITAVILTFIGCVLTAGISGGGYSVTFGGILCGIGAGFGYALYSIFGRYGVKKYNDLTVTAYTFIFASLASAFFITPDTFIKAAAPDTAVFIIIFGILSCVIPYLVYTKALTIIETGRAATVAALEPVVATLVSFIYFGETPIITKITGIIIVIIALALLNLNDIKKSAE